MDSLRLYLKDNRRGPDPQGIMLTIVFVLVFLMVLLLVTGCGTQQAGGQPQVPLLQPVNLEFSTDGFVGVLGDVEYEAEVCGAFDMLVLGMPVNVTACAILIEYADKPAACMFVLVEGAGMQAAGILPQASMEGCAERLPTFRVLPVGPPAVDSPGPLAIGRSGLE